jgi:hypothetical protein
MVEQLGGEVLSGAVLLPCIVILCMAAVAVGVVLWENQACTGMAGKSRDRIRICWWDRWGA